jgi:hypothetical protein
MPRSFIAFILLVSPIHAEESHESANLVYQQLSKKTFQIGTQPIRVPSLLLPDGLSAKEQQLALTKLIEGDYDLEEFTRDSVVAPFLLKIENLPKGQQPIRKITLIFVVFVEGDLTDEQRFANRDWDKSRPEIAIETLSTQQLSLFKIQKGERESFARITLNFFDRVELQLTGHSMWSRTAESYLVAATTDPRFLADPQFSNSWRSLEKNGDSIKRGEKKPYSAAMQFTKITSLKSVEHAFLVEHHLLFAEPEEWFDGANLLRSKFPPIAQSIVRSTRRELKKR